MGGIIAAVVLIVVAIGFSAWWKGRLIGQGKIIQRAKTLWNMQRFLQLDRLQTRSMSQP